MHTICAHYMCTLYVHTICAHYMCTLYVHTICAHYMCTLYVHTICAHHEPLICLLRYIVLQRSYDDPYNDLEMEFENV